MEEHDLTWHESEDGRTMMKVPTLIHQNVPHNGGVNAVKREAVACADYDVYDSHFITEKQKASGGNDSLGNEGTNDAD